MNKIDELNEAIEVIIKAEWIMRRLYVNQQDNESELLECKRQEAVKLTDEFLVKVGVNVNEQ